MAAKEGTLGWLRGVCRDFRRDLLSAEHATAEDIAAIWPGGVDNPDKKLKGWVRCHGVLHALNALAVSKKLKGQDANNEERKAAVLAALLDTPETVQLVDVDSEGERRSVIVYPKSAIALGEIQDRNLALASLCDSLEFLEEYGDAFIREHGTAKYIELLIGIHREQSYLQRVLIWIATHPGPGLPFPEYATAPEPPEQLAELHTADLYSIPDAFQRVNVKRLTLLDATRSNETRPDWSIVLATLAGGLNRDTAAVMRDTSLASFISQASERARGHEQAMREAEKKRKTKAA